MKIKLAILVVISGLFFGGCSLPFERKSAPVPTPAPKVEVMTSERAPFATLTITADKESGVVSGHTFAMRLQNLNNTAKTLEYLILYDLPDGRQQGIPGTIELGGKASVSRDDLLMGSCSKTCRYDQGVTKGTMELTYRDEGGATLGDILGDWHLQSGEKKLTSVDEAFSFEVPTKLSGWSVTMNSLGLPGQLSGKLLAGPYVVTSSGIVAVPGTVSFNLSQEAVGVKVYLWNGQTWQELVKGLKVEGQKISVSSPSLGTFVAVSS